MVMVSPSWAGIEKEEEGEVKRATAFRESGDRGWAWVDRTRDNRQRSMLSRGRQKTIVEARDLLYMRSCD
jgi:hypothetical protein